MKTLNKKTFTALMFVAVSASPFANVQAATCGGFTMNADAGSTGDVVSCTTDNKNIEFNGNNVITTPSDNPPAQDILFSNVTDLTSSITGLVNNAGQVNGFGSFSIAFSVWDAWNSIYIGLKQGSAYGLFLLTSVVDSGTWQTSPGNGTGLSHYIAFGGEAIVPSPNPNPNPNPVPVPAAVWLFGSGLLGLIGTARKKSAAAQA